MAISRTSIPDLCPISDALPSHADATASHTSRGRHPLEAKLVPLVRLMARQAAAEAVRDVATGTAQKVDQVDDIAVPA